MNTCQYIDCTNEASNKYCSLSCSAKEQFRVNPKPKKINLRLCLLDSCGNEFNAVHQKANSKFCSRSCSATFNNKLRGSKSSFCLRCSAPCSNKFCSISCSSKYRSEQKLSDWLSGDWDGTSAQGCAALIRRYLIEQAGFKCASPNCAVPGGFGTVHPTTGKVPLEIDHIDGDCYNNKRDNLIVLCPNCHALTPTYKALNKESQRSYRKIDTPL